MIPDRKPQFGFDREGYKERFSPELAGIAGATVEMFMRVAGNKRIGPAMGTDLAYYDPAYYEYAINQYKHLDPEVWSKSTRTVLPNPSEMLSAYYWWVEYDSEGGSFVPMDIPQNDDIVVELGFCAQKSYKNRKGEWHKAEVPFEITVAALRDETTSFVLMTGDPKSERPIIVAHSEIHFRDRLAKHAQRHEDKKLREPQIELKFAQWIGLIEALAVKNSNETRFSQMGYQDDLNYLGYSSFPRLIQF